MKTKIVPRKEVEKFPTITLSGLANATDTRLLMRGCPNLIVEEVIGEEQDSDEERDRDKQTNRGGVF